MVKRLAVFAIGVMMDAVFGIVFVVLGSAYALAKAEIAPFDLIASGDVMWLMGATVIVSAALNLPGELRRWGKPE